ncbi:MAG: hypothetical protein V8R64_08290 [Thomasclavelia sp.]
METLNRARDGFLGSITINKLRIINLIYLFRGGRNRCVHYGKVTTYDVDDGLTKKEVINSSKKSYMVAETAKIKIDGNYVFADIGDFTGYYL